MNSGICVNLDGLAEVHFIDRNRFKNPIDKWLGFSLSLSAHIALLLIGGLIFIKPIEFGIDQGLSGMEVQLVAGSDEPVAEPVVQEIKPEIIEEPVKNFDAVEIPQEIAKLVEPVKPTTLGNSAINAVSSSQGAETEIKASYLRNPAPRYPAEARQKGWQGTVLLRVTVDQQGMPANVAVKKSSGHVVLDEAALKTVKTWKFRPARMGNMKVDSTVEVPVRFDLKKQ